VSWLRLRIDLTSEQIESTELLLESVGALSISLCNSGTDPVLEPDPGQAPLWQSCRLEALFDLDVAVAEIRQVLAQADLSVVSVDFVDDQDWQNKWRQYGVEFCFADRLWVVPRDVEPPGGAVLMLDPGLAFGSGAHPTTRLCLHWLAGQDLKGARVLDFGCGSGILGLAALKLDCERVVAIDHDPQALLATRENAAYNGLLDDRLVVGSGSVQGEFEVVLANILANPLIELAPMLSAAVLADGALVLSGLLDHQIESVVTAYPEVRFDPPVLESDEQGVSWALLTGRKIAD
jgi:ribosomal protein L11 methyltransferase